MSGKCKLFFKGGEKMKGYLFLSYPTDSYYLAHIYEQLLAFELIKNNLVWETGNIGNGYIFVEWKIKIDKNKILELIKIPNLDKSSLEKAQKIVIKETKKNIELKTFFELCHFQIKTCNELFALLEQKISVELMNNFISTIVSSSEIVIIYNESYLIDTRKKQSSPPLKMLFNTPIVISAPNNKTNHFVIATNARSVLDGYVFEVFGKEIVKNFANKITFLSILDNNKTLFLTFSAGKDFDIKKIEPAIKLLASVGFQGPLSTRDNISSLNYQIFQYFDWKKVLASKKIKKELETRPSYNFQYHNGTLFLLNTTKPDLSRVDSLINLFPQKKGAR